MEAPGSSVVTYRPFLSYNELGSLIDGKPSEMYDALYTLLGLEDLATAQQRIIEARKDVEQRAKSAREAKKDLLDRVDGLDDERAKRLVPLLRAPTPDLEALGNLALGSDEDAEIAGRLRALAGLTLPARDAVAAKALEVDEAREALTAASSSQVRMSAVLAELLRRALVHHTAHGDGPCPVCRQGSLDDAWRADAERRVEEAQGSARLLASAQDRVDEARRELGTLVTTPPEALSSGGPLSTDAALEAWRRWRAALDADDVAPAVDAAEDVLRPAVSALVGTAQTELAKRDDTWRPIATELVALHAQLTRTEKEAPRFATLKKAEKWIKSAASSVRDQRMEPLAEHSQQVWKDLRQQSDVDLTAIRLKGAATRREATFDVTVDGIEGAALGVMSQGELHSLALSLFLPRATVEDSPFRFVLVDDPVQAMDPAKVDGLARVLATFARDRQVIVFSHDDRLAESVRRAQIPARIVEVVRRDRSRVELRPCGDPVERHLDDARALVRTEHIPDDLRGELVASYCRSALEAAAHAAYRRSRLARGDDRDDVEARITAAHKLHAKLTLAVFHDPDRAGDLYGRLRAAVPRAVDTMKACKEGAHGGAVGDVRGLIDDVDRLASWVGRQ